MIDFAAYTIDGCALGLFDGLGKLFNALVLELDRVRSIAEDCEEAGDVEMLIAGAVRDLLAEVFYVGDG